jgi:hypothetical protein
MGFNKKYVRPLDELKKELEENPERLKYYIKADALIGPSESIQYIEDLIKKSYELKDR